MIRLGISAVEGFGCIAGIELANCGYPITGFLVVWVMIGLAWAEGHNGWGAS